MTNFHLLPIIFAEYSPCFWHCVYLIASGKIRLLTSSLGVLFYSQQKAVRSNSYKGSAMKLVLGEFYFSFAFYFPFISLVRQFLLRYEWKLKAGWNSGETMQLLPKKEKRKNVQIFPWCYINLLSKPLSLKVTYNTEYL